MEDVRFGKSVFHAPVELSHFGLSHLNPIDSGRIMPVYVSALEHDWFLDQDRSQFSLNQGKSAWYKILLCHVLKKAILK